MTFPLVYDPDDAFEQLDALYDSDRVLYGRVYDLLEALQEDPMHPGHPWRPHALRDRDGAPISAVTVRSGEREVLVIWGARTDADGDFVRISYIGDNILGY